MSTSLDRASEAVRYELDDCEYKAPTKFLVGCTSRLLHDGVLPHVVRPLHELTVPLARRIVAMDDLGPMEAAGSRRSKTKLKGRHLLSEAGGVGGGGGRA